MGILLSVLWISSSRSLAWQQLATPSTRYSLPVVYPFTASCTRENQQHAEEDATTTTTTTTTATAATAPLFQNRRSFVATTTTAVSAIALFACTKAARAVTDTSTTSIATTTATATSSSSSFAERLKQDKLVLPNPTPYTSEGNGVDNTYVPSYLAGTWNVTQTLVDVKTPVGLKFAGGPNGDETIARATIQQARARLNVPIQFQLRYVPTKWGVTEDRVFNIKQRLNAFAGKSVVSTVEYANVGTSNRQAVLAMGGKDTDPLQTTIVRFKGPAAQKTFVISHGGDDTRTTTAPSSSSASSSAAASSSWSGYELQRSIFALTNQNTAPPITTDTELIWQFQPPAQTTPPDRTEGKLRLAGYLNAQSDKLYFDANKRAVTIQDYTLDMVRVTAE